MATSVTPVDVLGGERVLGKKVREAYGINSRLRAGLPYSALEAVQQALSLSREETATALCIPLRTLARRKRERKLSADESDRAYRLAHLLAHALRVFDESQTVSSWMRTPSPALGMVTPLSLLDTAAGVEQVDTILGRIEYGVYS
jgi:putative toxin-antitoxin system antitoxin component (TIGR02293 family)